jgi:hypothetical protein
VALPKLPAGLHVHVGCLWLHRQGQPHSHPCQTFTPSSSVLLTVYAMLVNLRRLDLMHVGCRIPCCRWAPPMIRRATTSRARCLSECPAAGSLEATSANQYILHTYSSVHSSPLQLWLHAERAAAVAVLICYTFLPLLVSSYSWCTSVGALLCFS